MKLKRSIILSLLLVFVLAFSSVTYALESNGLNISSELDMINMEEPAVVFDLDTYGDGVLKRDVNGDFHGELQIRSSTGLTVVSCTLSGFTGGVANLYSIYIWWMGTNQVANIQATDLRISTTSILSPETFYSDPFFVNAGSTIAGFQQVGVVIISMDVKRVRIRTRGLQTYFNNTHTWISTGNINGTVDVNQ